MLQPISSQHLSGILAYDKNENPPLVNLDIEVLENCKPSLDEYLKGVAKQKSILIAVGAFAI